MESPFEIVLIEPQIPQNTGSIARTCAATGTPLHIVGDHPFEISEKAVRRAGLDYWPHVKLFEHPTWDEYERASNPRKVWCIETTGERLYHEATFEPGDALIFGSETVGINKTILGRYKNTTVRIPITCEGVRSLNLSNAVSIVLYEALRQVGYPGGPG